MTQLVTYPFVRESFRSIKEYHLGSNWPVVYLIEGQKEMYVGETTSAYRRSIEHFDTPTKTHLDRMHVLYDEEFNMSANKDIESLLIEHMAADEQYMIVNKNSGLKNHNYFDRERYRAKFERIWDLLKEKALVRNSLRDIRNSDVFKYSPYKALTEEQLAVVERIVAILKKDQKATVIVQGGPGTGKTILATYVIKLLRETEGFEKKKIGLVVPMTPLRVTLERVFRKVKGLKSNMVLGPSDVVGEGYDLLVVDEAHRLRQRKNITNYKTHDDANKVLGLGNEGTELDWILRSSAQQIFLYDPKQSVRPTDVLPIRFEQLHAERLSLSNQMRVKGGVEYIEYVSNLFASADMKGQVFKQYDFRLYDSIADMVQAIKDVDREHSLARMVAGYAWSWETRNGSEFDIEIDGTRLTWNSTNADWVNSPNALNEVGCIHTVQGYDLNYAGVILGPEIVYDAELQRVTIDPSKYKDANGKRGVTDRAELERYIINIYTTLLSRAILGTFVYVCDPALREYVASRVHAGYRMQRGTQVFPQMVEMAEKKPLKTYVAVPLVGSAPCGNPLMGEENIEEYIDVDASKIRKGFRYFIVRATGDSMDKAGIHDGDLVLCRFGVKGETGDKVVALLGGENVTIKYYDKQGGRRILLPKSSNPSHKPIIPDEGDSVQGVVQEVI